MTSQTLKPPFLKMLSDFVQDENQGSYKRPVSDIKRLPVSIYTDPARYALEQERIFKVAPIVIGHISMIPAAGDHFTFDHLGQPLLVVRGPDMAVRVFYNVCRHRGVRLARNDSVSRSASFVCPYHNWTYGLDGTLISVPCEESFVNDDVSGRNLKRVGSGVSSGFIYVSCDPSLNPEIPLDLDPYMKEFAEDFEALKFADQVFFDQSTRTVKANWKLLIEAFQDGYHVVRLHRKTVGPLFLDNVADIERVQNNLRALVARNGFAELKGKDAEDWDVRNAVSLAYLLSPNSVLVIHPDYISHLGVYPRAPDECIAVHSCFIDAHPKSEKEAAHFKRAFEIIDEGVFNSEDFFVCEQAQKGMESGANDDFPLSDFEIGIKLFHEILNEQLA
ncbi:MAG: aromatic ring-hydroxylating oxygenase subunit alpha [Maricaulaceae bacterium]